MNVLLIQIDGKLPNYALMRIAAHHRSKGDDVRLVHGRGWRSLLFFRPDLVYASAIFEWSRPICEELRRDYTKAQIGGTGVDTQTTLESIGITTPDLDYSIYPRFLNSIGFSQRGCRLRCGFCVVPKKEGGVTEASDIAGIWRGEGYPRNLILLDNDFFGQPDWRERIREIRDGGFRVCLTQGINVRFLNDETADALASVQYYDDSFTQRRIYTAWDASRKNLRDGVRVASGLWKLRRRGVKPREIMVYMLVGYWPGETHEDRDLRRRCLRRFGALPYPMPFQRTAELVGFQRWVIGAYDRRIEWKDWKANNYRPEGLAKTPLSLFSEVPA